ncbi:hypothetical protein ACPB9E_10775 [Streptomyces exfoliatus]|uniref:hypothetical protein n=1 Tax=Streptomyces exfoliatus TaxID=1905 RepID=UPI003C2D1B3D
MDSAVAQLKSASRAVVQDLVDDAEGTGVTSYEIDDQELADIRAVARAELETGETTLINDTAPVSAQQDAPSRPSGVDLARLALFQARQDAKQRGNDRPKCTPPPEEGSHPVPRARAGRARRALPGPDDRPGLGR